MANTWIKLQTSTPDKAEVLKIARIMGVSKYDAMGRLAKFWIWLDGVCVDGVVDGVVDADIDMLVDHNEFSNALHQVGWIICDNEKERITIPNFEVHNGDSAKKRAQKSKRQAGWRQKNDAPVDVVVDVVVDAPVVKPPSTREEKRREENIKEQFESMWISYGRRGSKKIGLERYLKLSDEDLSLVADHYPKYVTSNDLQFRAYIEKYIGQRLFEGVIIEDSKSAGFNYNPKTITVPR